jgi:hypothetical protein
VEAEWGAQCYFHSVVEWLLGIASAVVVGILAWAFTPLRNWLEPSRLRFTSDHGVKLSVYFDPDDMAGLDVEKHLGMAAQHLPGLNYFFAADRPPARPPAHGEEWWQWGKRHGGEDAYASHVLLLLQATQDRAITVSVPRVDRKADTAPRGIICGPEGQGGNGLLVRRYYIDLDQPDPVRARFINQDQVECPRFTLNKGETVAVLAIAVASSGRHEWRLSLPMTVDGQNFDLNADNHGRPFVTVGRGELPFAMAVPSDMPDREGTGWMRSG